MENHEMLSIIVKAYNITYDIDEEDVEFAGVSSKEDLIKTLPKELELDVDFATGNSIQQEYDNRDLAVYDAIWAAVRYIPKDFSYKILKVC